MRAFFTKLGLLILQLFGLVARFQMWLVTKVCPLIPGWSVVEGLCKRVLAPVHTLGSFLQRKFPGLCSLEWLLEIDGLRARHPVLLAFALTMVFVRGMQPTDLGHIGTDAIIYPLLGGLSYLNPFLGLVAAIAFGAGDLVQKIVWDDVYYTGTKTMGDWIGARVGYLVAYAGLAVMGLAPGMLSRVFSLIVRKILQGVFRREAQAVSDGVDDASSGGGGGGGMRFPPDMPMEERQRIIAAMQAAGGQPTRLNPSASSLGGASVGTDSAISSGAHDASMQPGLGGVSSADSARGMGGGFGGARGWAVDASASGAGGTVSSVVRADSWRQAVSAGHPLARDWDMYLASRGAPGADTLERMQIPPHGLQAAIERTGAPPGGWANLCSDTGVPMEPWMNTPGEQPPGGAAQWLASRGIPAGPPVPSAADWLAQTAVDAPAGVRDSTDEEIAAAKRARARHAAEDLKIRRELDAANEEARREQIAMQKQWAAQHGGIMPGSVMPGSNMPGSIMPMPNGGPPDVAFVFPELIASLLGAALGGWGVVKFVAPHSEWPAFYLRPNADIGCYNLEDKILDSTANWSAGTVPGIGPAVTALIPPVGPTGPAGPPTGPTGPDVPGGPVIPGGVPESPQGPDGGGPVPTPQTTSGDGVLDDPRAELDRVNKQWEDAKQGVDPKDPGYDAFKKQYDDYRDSLKDKIAAQEAARAAAEAEARAAQEAAASAAAGLSAVIATRDYHQNNANRLRQDLANATDPRVREELTRRIESTEANVASADDEIHRAKTGEFRRTRTAWDDRQDKIQAEQSRRMADDFKASAMERRRQEAIVVARAKLEKAWEDKKKTDAGYWQDIKDGFWGGVVSDVDAIPGQLKDAAYNGAKYIGDTIRDTGRALKDPDNWRSLGQAVVQTGKDLIGSPIQSAKKVGGLYVDVGTTVAKVGAHVVTHPVETIKAIAGVDNWAKSMDPNIPVTERIGRVFIGIADAAMNITGAGLVGKGAKVADAVVDAAKVADKVGDAVRSADKVLDATKAADKVSDAAKGAKAADAAGDARKVKGVGEPAYAPRGAKATEASPEAAAAAAEKRAADAAAKKRADAYFKGTPDAAAARQEAWKEAQTAGKSKVDEFDKARREAKEATKSGDAAAKAAAEDRLRKATLDVQGDKQALWEINKREDAVKKGFNKEMNGIYQKTDKKVVDDLCAKNGIDPKDLREQPPGSGIFYNDKTGRPDIVIVKPTNPKAGVSVGADRDVTVRVRQYGDKLVADPENPGKFIKAGDKGVLTDVPSKELAPTYNEAFHDASGAGKHYPGSTPDEIAHKMDQVATDRLHPEAYGRGQKDLNVAIRKPGEAFSDAEQVSKAAQFKSEHLYDQSSKLAAEGKRLEACGDLAGAKKAFQESETAMAEGMRQSTKQFDRQIMGRAEALKAQGVDVKIPPRLADDIGIMKKAQTEGWSPARITHELGKRGTTVEKVTQQSASMIEAMQKLRPR